MYFHQALTNGAESNTAARVYRVRANPWDDMSEREFKNRFRFSKEGAKEVCKLFANELEPVSNAKTSLSGEQKMLTALCLLARNQMQDDTAQLCGVSQSSISRVLHEVCEIIAERASEFVVWPTEEVRKETANRIFASYRLPNIAGIIDGTHVRLQRPVENEEDFVNRKGFHSLNVSAIVDDNRRFLWISTAWPGSSHDSHVFRSSKLYAELVAKEKKGFLIGDSAYSAESFLIKPFLKPSNNPEKRYNSSLTSLRSRVENAFGCLKRQFHILHGESRYSPEFVCKIVSTCVVLRNIFIAMREVDDFDDLDVDVIEMDENVRIARQADTMSGTDLMKKIVAEYFA